MHNIVYWLAYVHFYVYRATSKQKADQDLKGDEQDSEFMSRTKYISRILLFLSCSQLSFAFALSHESTQV